MKTIVALAPKSNPATSAPNVELPLRPSKETLTTTCYKDNWFDTVCTNRPYRKHLSLIKNCDKEKRVRFHCENSRVVVEYCPKGWIIIAYGPK